MVVFTYRNSTPGRDLKLRACTPPKSSTPDPHPHQILQTQFVSKHKTLFFHFNTPSHHTIPRIFMYSFSAPGNSGLTHYFTHRHSCYTHTSHWQAQANPKRTAPLKGNKENTNRVHITYITSSLRMNQNLRVLPKLNIYINTPTPHAGLPEANHAKARLFQSQPNWRKSAMSNLHQDIPTVIPMHQHWGSNQELHSFFTYFGPDSNFRSGYKH